LPIGKGAAIYGLRTFGVKNGADACRSAGFRRGRRRAKQALAITNEAPG
jgi:hypothetical protein